MPRLPLALTLALTLLAGSAAAQPPPGPPVHVERRSVVLEGGAVARLATRWTPDAATSGASLALGEGAPTILVRGATAAAIELGERGALVAYEAFDGAEPFRVRLVRRDAGRDVLSDELRLARPGARQDDVPFAVAIAPIAGRGFAVFFEEVQHDDPSAVRTYVFALDLDGRALDAGREIPIPWPLAAASWNGHGFHLAVFYPGSGTGMRLSMVSITEAGDPQQHPDWSSAAGFVSDVHLVTQGDHIAAQYRGGTSGERWLECDVTQIRSWGVEPQAPTDHGRLEPDATIAIDSAGHARRVPARDDGLATP